MFRLPNLAHRWTLAAACMLVLCCGRPACGQSPFWGLTWLQPALMSDWLTRFWADDEQEDGTRLARLPDMYGDSFGRGGTLTAVNSVPTLISSTDVVLGGARGLKVAEHNKAIPMNRVYLTYNYFHNAADFGLSVPPLSRNLSLHRYTFGAESRFADGLWSLELQMPFAGEINVADPGGLVESHTGAVGNLSAILKRLIYYDGRSSVVAGLGVETPTGSDFVTRTSAVNYHISNDAVHLHPYVGVLDSPNDDWFFHGFAQLDVATHGNRVTFDDARVAGNVAGRFNDQTLLYVDVGGGCWLWRESSAPLATGLAAILEFHYTTTLTDADSLLAFPATTGGQVMFLTNRANRLDVVNATAAIHAQLDPLTSLRVGGVFPLRSADNRFFDAEFSAQLIRRY